MYIHIKNKNKIWFELIPVKDKPDQQIPKEIKFIYFGSGKIYERAEKSIENLIPDAPPCD